MASTLPPPADGRERQAQDLQRVLDVVRGLAFEVSGDRAARAVTASASLERDIGLGSLERVELLARLETAFQRELGEALLVADTPGEIVRALAEAPATPLLHPRAVPSPTAAPAVLLREARTLVEALGTRAAVESQRVHARFFGDAETTRLTYGDLWDGARRIAGGLMARGVARGDTVALMLPTGPDYLRSFMGIVAAGAIAVPLYPPARLDRMREYLQRQSRILANAEARLMIAMPEAAPVARMLRSGAPDLASVIVADDLRTRGNTDPLPEARPDDPAMIQYTSGSTGDPKGVLLSHANLLANIRAMASAIALRPTDAVVSWLPLYHDMGLIGTWLSSMVFGIPLVLMNPLAFLARPERWLWAIHQYRGTLSPAPNFAYELCVRKIRDDAIHALDLSSWRCAFNGSEPVSEATIAHFTRRFAPFGFHPEAMTPVYGLAESSVGLAFPPIGRAPRVDHVVRETFAQSGRAIPAAPADRHPLSFVSVGIALPGHDLRVVGDDGKPLGERLVGRVLFRGPSCMSAYYHNPAATERSVLADRWIDSGDLAYVADGELYLTGRIKDLIIKGGRNLVPQEIEELVGAVEGVRKGCVVAFGLPDPASGTERLVVLAESRLTSAADRDRLEREILTRVATEIGIPADIVRVAAPGIVPKTPSGKIRRSAARDAFASGTLVGATRLPLRLRVGLMAAAAKQRLRAGGAAVWRGLEALYLAIAWSVVVLVLGPPSWALAHTLAAGRQVRALSRVLARIALAISICPIRVEGRQRVPARGPLVFVANHSSYGDIAVLVAAIPSDFTFVAMKEILDWRFIGTLARRGLHPLVDRWHPQQSVADAAVIEARLRAGERLLYFPEGGMSRPLGIRPFRMGAFEAAVAAGAPVIPVAVRGTRQALPAGSRVPHPRRLEAWIGEPIQPVGEGWNAALDLRERAANAIAEHSGEPRRDIAVTT